MKLAKVDPAPISRVSVVVVTYMRAAEMSRCLESLVNQTFKDFEVLVCDDGSTDDTATVVKRFDQKLNVSYHWAANSGGPARPRNRGLRLARAEYVTFLDSDDWWAPRKLERSVQQLDQGADVVYHDLYLARNARSVWRLRRAATQGLPAPVFKSLIEYGNVLTSSSVVLRRQLLLDIDGINEDPEITTWEDYDCWLRLSKVTEKFSRIAEPLGWYWIGGGNFSSPKRTIRNLERMRETYLRPSGLNDDVDMPGWYHYGLGRASYHLRNHALAVEHMRYAIRRKLPMSVLLKALLTICLSLLRRRT